MKQHRNRQRTSRNRNSTPSVICLPAAKPPVTAKRPMAGSGPALTLPQTAEPLAFESRQVRRQNRRNQSKQDRRDVTMTAPVEALAEAETVAAVLEPVAVAPIEVLEIDPAAEVVAADPVPPVTSSVPLQADTIAPLPRNRALAPTRKGIVATLLAWLRKPARKRPDPTVIGQLQAIRDEVAGLQRSLDRALEQMA